MQYHQGGAASDTNAICPVLLERGFSKEDVFFDQESFSDVRNLFQAVKDSVILLQL
jgi:hypothetical protein